MSAPARRTPRRLLPAGVKPCEPARLPAPEGTVIPLFSTRKAPAQHLVTVEFASPDGRSWRAIGGGDTLAEALAFARESCPTGTTWRPVCWNDLYGD